MRRRRALTDDILLPADRDVAVSLHPFISRVSEPAAHESNNRSLFPRQDRRPSQRRRLEPHRRRERPVRARAAGRLAGRLRALRSFRPARGGDRGQARQCRPNRRAGSGAPLRRTARRTVRIPVERRGGPVPRPRDGRPRTDDRHLPFPGRPGAAYRRPQEPAGPVRCRDRPADRRPRLPDRVHRGAVDRCVTRPAQAARGDGDRNRQDTHGGGVRQAAVRGGHRDPRPVPRGPDRARGAGRGRLQRPSARLSLPRAPARPGLRPGRSGSRSRPCRR